MPAVSAYSYFNDISRFDPKTNAWTTLTTLGPTPSGRWWMGFSAAPDGTILLFGGGNGDGGDGGRLAVSLTLAPAGISRLSRLSRPGAVTAVTGLMARDESPL